MDVKVGTDGIDKINSEYIKPGIKRSKASEKVPGVESDRGELSSNALELKEMEIKTMSFPDVRPEKVEQIKTQVNSSTYNIAPEKIAERLIEAAMELNP